MLQNIYFKKKFPLTFKNKNDITFYVCNVYFKNKSQDLNDSKILILK